MADDTWTFYINYYVGEPKASIVRIDVGEYTSGKAYPVTRGGTVTVHEERIRVSVTLKNVGNAAGIIYAKLTIDGKAQPVKSISLAPGSMGPVYWDLEIEPGKHTVTVEAWH